jgi:nucleotide-binding universal stress UspA family protein
MKPIRTILAATDLSAASDRVLRTAAVLAGRSGARLYVLHAVEPLAAMPVTAFGAAGTGMEAQVVQQEWLNARATLDAQLARVFGDAHHPHDLVFVEGESAPRAICARAEQLGADLIVIGPHAGGEGGVPLLGTTADGVLRSAGAPVLVVRGTVPAPLARLLVATDLTEPGTGIVAAALGWAAAFSSRAEGGTPVRVDVVHVILDVVSGTMPFSQATVQPGANPGIGEAAAHAPGVDVRERVLFGESVVDAVLEYARETSPDLLVAGSHGRGAIARALVGSTSSALARQAPCSVLLVPQSLWTAEHGAPEDGESARTG